MAVLGHCPDNGYCWSTSQCRKLCFECAFAEGLKISRIQRRHNSHVAWKEDDQQYPGGYCWSPPKDRNWCAHHAFFEDKKAEQTSSRKSTPRTLKGVDQQYPGVNRVPSAESSDLF